MKDELYDCVIMDKTTTADGYGGVVTTWVEGAEFKAAIVPDTSTEASIAMAQTQIDRYTVVTEPTIVFEYGDTFKRGSDSKYFRVVEDGYDRVSPKVSTLNMRVVKARALQGLIPSMATQNSSNNSGSGQVTNNG